MSEPIELTDKQREVLVAIHTLTGRYGYPPTVRELGEAVGLTSPSTVHAHLAALERRGAIRRHPTKSRTVVIEVAS